VVFSKDEFELNLNKKTTYINELGLFKNDKTLNIEVIFNVNSFTFKEIIHFMELNKSSNITFKNYVFSSDFMIGSNSSNDRGKVILIENLK